MGNFFWLLIFLPFLSHTQNLVPNPSFEEYESLKCDLITADYKLPIKNWSSAQLYEFPLTASHTFDTACERYFNKPKTGLVAMKLLTSGELSGGIQCTYLQCKLLKPLVPGKKYHLEFWMKGDENAPLSYNNIGVYFSRHELKSKEVRIRVSSLIPKTQINYFEQGGWTKFSLNFELPGQAIYMVIGNFYNTRPSKEEYEDILKKDIKTYYHHIDDLSLTEGEIIQTLEGIQPDIPVILKNIIFEENSAVLLRPSFDELEKLAALLKNNSSAKIQIYGHTDDQGEDNYNQTLSETRARAVYEYLIKRNIDSRRLSFKGFGETKPVAGNNSEEGRKKNRRVEFVIEGNESSR